jgi:hypothetical protein
MRINRHNTINFKLCPLREAQLFRRAIGRNIVASSTNADVVWFADCDYFYGEHCIDTLIEKVTQDDIIHFPSNQLISISHEDGDDLIESNRVALLPMFDPNRFVPKRIGKSIGGLQVVTGNTSRNKGYLDGTKWIQPVDDISLGFRDTKCDISYRKSLPNQAITIPNLYRLRHSVTGLNVSNKIRGQQ